MAKGRGGTGRGAGRAREGGERAGTSSGAASPSPPGPDSHRVEDLPAARLHIWQVQAVRDVLVVAAVVGLFWVGYALRTVTVPLLVALLLAYLFEPLIERICARRTIRRPVAVGGLLGVVALVLVVVVALVLPLVVDQTAQLVDDVREGEMRRRVALIEPYVPGPLLDPFRQVVHTLPAARAADGGAGGPTSPPEAVPGAADRSLTPGEAEIMIDRAIGARIEQLRAEFAAGRAAEGPDWKNLARDVKAGFSAVFGIIGAAVQFGLVLFLIPFYFFFFSNWYPAVVKFARDLIPSRNRAHALKLLEKMDRVVAGFVRGRIVISLIMGVLLAVGWAICGVPYWIVLGVVVGILCAVPYLGTVGVPLSVGLLLISRLGDPGNSGAWWAWTILWPTVVFGIVQLIEGYVLTPMIAGKATNLDPVTILVAVLAGGSVLGVYGMILAIPLAACGKILFNEVLLPNIRTWTRGEAADPLPIDRD